MDNEEILEWYDVVCSIFEEESDVNRDLIITGAYYWADELYNNMDSQTKELSKVK